MGRYSVSHRGRPDAISRELGEQLRREYLCIMEKQATRMRHQPDWF